MKNLIKTEAGFTLVEALVAIAILLIGVLGPLAAAVRGITDGMYARNQIIANFLAMEGMEKIINRRDSNVLRGEPAFSNFSPLPGQSETENDLGFDPDSRHYQPNRDSGLTFDRLIATEIVAGDQNNPEEIRVTVKVSWHDKPPLPERTLTLNEYLYALP